QLNEESPKGNGDAPLLDEASALRVIQLQEGCLLEHTGGALAGRMERIALELGGTALPTGGEDSDRPTAQGERGGKVKGIARRQAGWLMRIWQNAFGRSRGASAQRRGCQRGPEQLNEASAIQPIRQLGGTGGELALEGLLKLDRALELLRAAPVVCTERL